METVVRSLLPLLRSLDISQHGGIDVGKLPHPGGVVVAQWTSLPVQRGRQNRIKEAPSPVAIFGAWVGYCASFLTVFAYRRQCQHCQPLSIARSHFGFYADETVILRVSDHPFIKKDSIIFFEDARWIPLHKVKELAGSRKRQFVCEIKERCSADLLMRIRMGLLKSKYMPNEIKEHCKGQWRLRRD